MKITTLFSLYAAGALMPGAFAWPGMAKTMDSLATKLKERDELEEGDSDEMIGDLATIGPVTPVGHSVANIIVGVEDGFSNVTYVGGIPGRNSKACAADTCCIWSYITADLVNKFQGKSGRCNGWARAAIRQGFHDAGATDKFHGVGGADGSLILAGEISRAENNGLQDIILYTQNVYNSYSSYGIGYADLIQHMAVVGAVVCPLGPRIRAFIGRKDSSAPAPTGLLPDVHADAESLIELFENKTIKSNGLAALVGAHTSSQQQFVNTSRAFDPQDSTPGVFDTVFFNQTLLPDNQVPKRVFKFPSDVALATHPEINSKWIEFFDQTTWNEYYSREYVRLSLLSVNNINNLTECTKVLPPATTSFTAPDKPFMKGWLARAKNTDKLGPYLNQAVLITSDLLKSLGIATS